VTVTKQDVIAQIRQARGLVEMHEEFSGGRDRRLVVAQFATRWCVLEGFRRAEPASYRVHGPFDRHLDARTYAIRVHNEVSGKTLWTSPKVES